MGKSKKPNEPTGPAGNCLDCAYHRIIADPDQEDWFCADDQAVVCTKAPNPTQDKASKFKAHHSPFRLITEACRPHHVCRESDRPNWCPLLN